MYFTPDDLACSNLSKYGPISVQIAIVRSAIAFLLYLPLRSLDSWVKQLPVSLRDNFDVAIVYFNRGLIVDRI
jgi:hypothetical protein